MDGTSTVVITAQLVLAKASSGNPHPLLPGFLLPQESSVVTPVTTKTSLPREWQRYQTTLTPACGASTCGW